MAKIAALQVVECADRIIVYHTIHPLSAHYPPIIPIISPSTVPAALQTSRPNPSPVKIPPTLRYKGPHRGVHLSYMDRLFTCILLLCCNATYPRLCRSNLQIHSHLSLHPRLRGNNLDLLETEVSE